MENDAATKWLRLAMETDRKKSKTEDGSYHTAQVGRGDRGRKKSINRNGLLFGFDLN